MSDTYQERVHRLIAERDAAIHQLAECFVRTGGEVYDVSLHHGNKFCFPYTIHEILGNVGVSPSAANSQNA